MLTTAANFTLHSPARDMGGDGRYGGKGRVNAADLRAAASHVAAARAVAGLGAAPALSSVFNSARQMSDGEFDVLVDGLVTLTKMIDPIIASSLRGNCCACRAATRRDDGDAGGARPRVSDAPHDLELSEVDGAFARGGTAARLRAASAPTRSPPPTSRVCATACSPATALHWKRRGCGGSAALPSPEVRPSGLLGARARRARCARFRSTAAFL